MPCEEWSKVVKPCGFTVDGAIIYYPSRPVRFVAFLRPTGQVVELGKDDNGFRLHNSMTNWAISGAWDDAHSPTLEPIPFTEALDDASPATSANAIDSRIASDTREALNDLSTLHTLLFEVNMALKRQELVSEESMRKISTQAGCVRAWFVEWANALEKLATATDDGPSYDELLDYHSYVYQGLNLLTGLSSLFNAWVLKHPDTNEWFYSGRENQNGSAMIDYALQIYGAQLWHIIGEYPYNVNEENLSGYDLWYLVESLSSIQHPRVAPFLVLRKPMPGLVQCQPDTPREVFQSFMAALDNCQGTEVDGNPGPAYRTGLVNAQAEFIKKLPFVQAVIMEPSPSSEAERSHCAGLAWTRLLTARSHRLQADECNGLLHSSSTSTDPNIEPKTVDGAGHDAVKAKGLPARH
ncbi:hypothetical protein B0T19DRAFT_442519 [Cercophora scortea]|uniref:Uncharacterized protein n=1 Tax=Cercophora scortea TaxID=314031 RepID=A0AAE0IP44_9PEZI|nr:hypothetical protein B0T19DRAFT_442519 [Cercophora scortea]